MTNAVNVEFIVEKLLQSLSSAIDDHFRTDLVGQITQCAERFAPSNEWYVKTVIKVFELAGDKVKSSVANTLTQLIAEGSEDNEEGEEGDDTLRSEAVEHFLQLIDKPKLPVILSQAMAWVLGEYGYLSKSVSKDVIMDKLIELSYRLQDMDAKAYIITALMKLVAQNGSCSAKVSNFILNCTSSQSLDIQQRSIEFKYLLLKSETMADVLPVDASCEDIDLDVNLSFLNPFVQQALANGAKPYSPPQSFHDDDLNNNGKKGSLNVTPYEMPRLPPPLPSSVASSVLSPHNSSLPTPLGPALTNQQSPALTISTAQGNQLLNSRGVSQVWGKKMEPPPTLPPSPVNTANSKVNTPISGSFNSIPSPPVIASSYSTRVEPEKPKVLTEKEKMAAALFGGVANSKSPSASNSNNSNIKNQLFQTSVSTQPYTKPILESVPSPNGNNIVKNITTSFIDTDDLLSLNSTSTTNNHQNDLFSDDIFSKLSVKATPVQTNTPLSIDTSEFGRRWGTTPYELKQNVTTSIKSLEFLRECLKTNYGHVESIASTQEAIFASNGVNNSVILLHVKLNQLSSSCDLTVKASTQNGCNLEITNIIGLLLSRF